MKLNLLHFLFWLPILAHSSPTPPTIYLPAPPIDLDWSKTANATDLPYLYITQDGLFRQRTQLAPAIAESLHKSRDLKTYTFKIRANAKWSDGRPIVAQDFVYAWLRALNPESPSPLAHEFFDIAQAEELHKRKITDSTQVGIYAVSDTVLTVKLKRPLPKWERQTALWPFFPLRKDLVEKQGGSWSRPGALVSSGAFRVQSYQENVGLKLVPNSHYWKAKTLPPSIEILVEPNGERNLDQHPKLPYKNFVFALMNYGKHPTSDLEFRRALLAKTKAESKKHLDRSSMASAPKLVLKILVPKQEPYASVALKLKKRIDENTGTLAEVQLTDMKNYNDLKNFGDFHILIAPWLVNNVGGPNFFKTAPRFITLPSGSSPNSKYKIEDYAAELLAQEPLSVKSKNPVSPEVMWLFSGF